MRDRNITWIQKINEIKQVCASAQLPIDVEVDKSPHGIDGRMVLGDLDFEKTGDVFDIDFSVHLVFSINKEKWQELLQRIMLLTVKLSDNGKYTFSDWTRVDDDTNLVYRGTVIIKGMVNPTLLS